MDATLPIWQRSHSDFLRSYALLFPNAALIRQVVSIHPVSLTMFPSSFTKPNPSTTYPPPLPTPKPHQTLPANLIPALQQRRYIHIERTIHLRVRKQLVDGLQRRRKRICRRPRCLQEVEADFTRFEIHVWVADWGRESDFGWCERVRGRDEDVEVPETGWKGWSVGRLEEIWFCLVFERG